MRAPRQLIELGSRCTGCGACAASCPKHCIGMAPDAAGFRYPHVQEDACVSCGRCEHTCPLLNETPRDGQLMAEWAISKSPDVRRSSSSGGVFPVLAQKTLEAGGIVVGAAFTADCLSVEHVSVSSMDELGRLTSSKYVQSTIAASVYEEVGRALRAHRRVLFSGTACQIAGLRGYLGKLAGSEELLCVEIVCHGVPSPLLWSAWADYQRQQLGADSLKEVNFRSKKTGWSTHSVVYRGSNNASLSSIAREDWYMRAFQADASIREACTRCSAKNHCGSDLTIGDYWGVQSAHRDLQWAEGVSLVLVRSEKGQRALQDASGELLLGASSYEAMLKGNPSLERPTKDSPLRGPFLQAVSEGASIAELRRRFPFRRGVKKWILLRLSVMRNKLCPLSLRNRELPPQSQQEPHGAQGTR